MAVRQRAGSGQHGARRLSCCSPRGRARSCPSVVGAFLCPGAGGRCCPEQDVPFCPALPPAWSSIPISTANAPGAPCQAGQCQQQHRLCKKGASGATVESQGSPFSHPPACLRAPRPATTTTQKESLQPPPRSHVLPELVEDEAGLVRQLAGRHAAGTGATLSWGHLGARGADPPASPTPGPPGAAATSGHSRSRWLLQGTPHPNQLL